MMVEVPRVVPHQSGERSEVHGGWLSFLAVGDQTNRAYEYRHLARVLMVRKEKQGSARGRTSDPPNILTHKLTNSIRTPDYDNESRREMAADDTCAPGVVDGGVVGGGPYRFLAGEGPTSASND